MKIINSIIGFFIILLGCSIMSITVFDEQFKTVVLKIIGFCIVVAGVYYLRNIARFIK